jgi:hypothetical protein
VESEDGAQELIQRAEDLANALGYDVATRCPLLSGSWWQRVRLKLREGLSEPEINKRARAVEDLLFGHGNIEIDNKVVAMTASLVAALKDSSSAAVIDCGLFLFIKLPDGDGSFHIFAKRLTMDDRCALNEDPTIVQSPVSVLSRLRDAQKIRFERVQAIKEVAAKLLPGTNAPA